MEYRRFGPMFVRILSDLSIPIVCMDETAIDVQGSK